MKAGISSFPTAAIAGLVAIATADNARAQAMFSGLGDLPGGPFSSQARGVSSEGGVMAINNSATKESRHDLGIGDCLGIDLEQILVQHDEIREFADFNGSDQLFLRRERSTTRFGSS